jgi:hypothetical protein
LTQLVTGLVFAGKIMPPLLTERVHAMLGLQFPLKPAVEQLFFATLFGLIFEEVPIDIAVNRARQAVYKTSSFDWAAPVLLRPR